MTVRTAAPSRSQPASRAARVSPKEVTTMIKKFLEMLYSGPKAFPSNPRSFDEELLEGHRVYVYALLHQQMRGLN
jgi:hypothetical protein